MSKASTTVTAQREATSVAGRERVRPAHPFVEFRKEEIEQSIGSRFETQASRFGDRTALQTATGHFTYAELNADANRVVRTILSCHPQSAQPVALLPEQSESMIASMLGTLKTGRPYVPLDVSFGAERNRRMLEDSQADLLIADRQTMAHARELAGDRVQVLNYDEFGPSLSGENVGVAVSPDAVAYILYTSGSTGEPKGVYQNHRNVLHSAMKTTNGLHIDSSDRLTLLASCSFAASVSDIFGALLNGAGLFPYSLRKRGLSKLAGWLADQEITIYHSSPTVFRHFTATLSGNELFPKVRLVKLGGEPVLKRDHALFQRHFPPGCIFHVNLGSTEMNGIRHFFATHETQFEGAVLPIGYEVADTEVLLLDENGRDVGFNREGEIVIRSPYLACGYWRKPEQTKSAFRADPHDDSVRLYRTGDLGMMRPDGCLFHLGRRDFQVKIRGHRVEVAEVELALEEIDGVRSAVVMGREDRSGEKRLVAYIVPRDGPRPAVDNLREALDRRLPDHLAPSAFVFLESLPLTATGKVDRNALPKPDWRRPELRTEFVAPQDAAEAKITSVWSETLGTNELGVFDNFFDLGGNSLLGLRLVDRLSRAFGVELSASDLIEAPTVAGIKERIARACTTGPSESPKRPSSFLVPIQASGSRSPLFFLPGGGGGDEELLMYARLMRHLAGEYPVYGLRARGTDGVQPPHTDVREMASDYLAEVRALQPYSPYFLAGECFGGIVAYEMAQQLVAQGQEVAFLALLDSPRPTRAKYWWFTVRRFLERIAKAWQSSIGERVELHWSNLGQLEPRKRPAYLLDKAGKAVLVLADLLRVKRLPDPEGKRDQQERIRHVRFDYPRRLQRYTPKPYRGRVTLLVNEQAHARKPDGGWSDLVEGGLEVHKLPGDHMTYIREHAAAAAAALKRCLEQARAGDGNRRGPQKG